MLLLTLGQVVIMTLKSEIVRLVVDSSGAVLGARPHGAAEAAARGQEQESRRGTCRRRRDVPQARGLDKGCGKVQGGGEEGPQERRSVQIRRDSHSVVLCDGTSVHILICTTVTNDYRPWELIT